jgi:hypothetical protein
VCCCFILYLILFETLIVAEVADIVIMKSSGGPVDRGMCLKFCFYALLDYERDR